MARATTTSRQLTSTVDVEKIIAEHFANNPYFEGCEVFSIAYEKDFDPETGETCQDTMRGAVILRDNQVRDKFHVFSFHISSEDSPATYWPSDALLTLDEARQSFRQKMSGF